MPQSVVERHRVLEEADGAADAGDDPFMKPGIEPWSEVDAEEPTQLEEEEEQQQQQQQKPVRDEKDVETVVGEDAAEPTPTPTPPRLDPRSKPPAGAERDDAEELQELAPILEPTPPPELISEEDAEKPAKMPFRKPPARLEPEPALVSKPDIRLDEPTDLEEQTILKEEQQPAQQAAAPAAAPQSEEAEKEAEKEAVKEAPAEAEEEAPKQPEGDTYRVISVYR